LEVGDLCRPGQKDNAGRVGYGSLLEAEEHAGAAIDRLKERTAREKAHLPTKQA
jgi:hypothetical protein